MNDLLTEAATGDPHHRHIECGLRVHAQTATPGHTDANQLRLPFSENWSPVVTTAR